MTIVILEYTLMISAAIRKAKRQLAITQNEADYLAAMAKNSLAAEATTALVNAKGAPDFLYAGLHFSTMIWQSGEARGCDLEASAGYKLAQFLLSQESPLHDSLWSAKLLREFYEAHQESAQEAVASVA